MPNFTIVSDDIADPAQDVAAANTGQLLGLIHRLGWRCADVAQEGRYLFSLSYDRDGVWTLTHRHRAPPLLRVVS